MKESIDDLFERNPDVEIPRVKPDENIKDMDVGDENIENKSEQVEEEQISEDEKKHAKRYGHKSKEEWIAEGRDPADWKDERKFNAFGELFPEMQSIKAELAKRNQAIEYLVEAQKRNAEESVKNARLELDRQLTLAKANGDIDTAIALAERKKELELDTKTPIEIERNRIDAAFLDRNPWFSKNTQLKQEATQIGNDYMARNPTIPYREVAKFVEEEMKYLHPELTIETPSRRDITNSRSAINKSTIDHSDRYEDDRSYKSLSDEERIDFKATKEMFDRQMKKYYKDEKSRPTYTMKDFLQSKNKYGKGR